MGSAAGRRRSAYRVEVAPGFIRTRREMSAAERLGLDHPRANPRVRAELLAMLERAEHDSGCAAQVEFRRGTRPVSREEREAFLSSCDEEHLRWLQEQALRDPETADQHIVAGALEWRRRRGRGLDGMGSRERARLWRLVGSLPFEMLGERPLFVTLTYPDQWRRWVPDGRVLARHLEAFRKLWERHTGENVMGVWTKEFQLKNGRPHYHLLLRGPDSMSDFDYRGYQALSRLAKKNEAHLGRYVGREKTPPISWNYGGQMSMWLRQGWAQIVTGNTDPLHYSRGVNVRTVFYSYDDEEARTRRRATIVAYIAGEVSASKAGQKQPPINFDAPGRFFGHWGGAAGFEPVTFEEDLPSGVGWEYNRRLGFLKAVRELARRGTLGPGWEKRRDGDGFTLGGVSWEEHVRILVAAEKAAARKAGRGLRA